MLVVHKILGNIGSDEGLRGRFEELEKKGLAEHIEFSPQEATKGRIRKTTDRGTELGIALERGKGIREGDVLSLDERRIIVARLKTLEALVITVRPAGPLHEVIETAVRLGHILGNQHWPMTFKEGVIVVPVTVDKKVMETVLKTYDLKGISYTFQGVEVEALAPSEVHPHDHLGP